jgi:hypothetical protein
MLSCDGAQHFILYFADASFLKKQFVSPENIFSRSLFLSFVVPMGWQFELGKSACKQPATEYHGISCLSPKGMKRFTHDVVLQTPQHHHAAAYGQAP